ncbi:MAG: O-antigen ligase [Gammaproteobacteria bacterium]
MLVLSVVPITSYQLPCFKARVDKVMTDITILVSEGVDLNKEGGSVSYRVELWRSAIDIFSENRLFGVGPGSFKVAMKKYVSENIVSKRFPNFKHAHNQLLHTIMPKGLIGALALILMITAYLYLCLKYIKEPNPPDVRALAFAACVISITFVVLGFTSAPMERKITLFLCIFTSPVTWQNTRSE